VVDNQYIVSMKELKIKVKKPIKLRCKWCKKKDDSVIPFRPFCSDKCLESFAKDYSQKACERKKRNLAKAEKEQRKKDKETREKLKTLSEWKHDLEVEINTIVRLIDKGHECISKGIPKYVVNAGHYMSVGSFPALRYNLLNIYAQSVHDNKERGGNNLAYRIRLGEVFGEDILEEIESLRGKYPILDISIPEIKEVLPVVRKIVRELKKQTEDLEKPFTTEERILIRRELNKRIGIYK
jgi:hypothetical protein